MTTEPKWLPLEEVVEINREAVAVTGEPFQILNKGLLESACYRPVNAWSYGEGDIVALACSLLFGIARNHAFQQGNKRTGFTAAVMFLNINGLDLVAPDSEDLAELVLSVVTGQRSEIQFVEIIRPFVRVLPA